MSLENYGGMPAFTVNTSRGIPGKLDTLTRNPSNSLMQLPKHRLGTSKFDKTKDTRTISSLTSEDKINFANLSLMSTLRKTIGNSSKKPSNTMIDNPPSFYDDEIRK